jgi:hypothetical protein
MDHTSPLRNCHVAAQVIMRVCREPPKEFVILNHSFVGSSLLSGDRRAGNRDKTLEQGGSGRGDSVVGDGVEAGK